MCRAGNIRHKWVINECFIEAVQIHNVCEAVQNVLENYYWPRRREIVQLVVSTLLEKYVYQPGPWWYVNSIEGLCSNATIGQPCWRHHMSRTAFHNNHTIFREWCSNFWWSFPVDWVLVQLSYSNIVITSALSWSRIERPSMESSGKLPTHWH